MAAKDLAPLKVTGTADRDLEAAAADLIRCQGLQAWDDQERRILDALLAVRCLATHGTVGCHVWTRTYEGGRPVWRTRALDPVERETGGRLEATMPARWAKPPEVVPTGIPGVSVAYVEPPAGLSTPEPPPTPGVAPATWDLVVADMRERDAHGAAKYGVRHQHDNGRDHLVDAYQELLDGALYIRAEIERRNAAKVRPSLIGETMDAMRELIAMLDTAAEVTPIKTPADVVRMVRAMLVTLK